MTSLLRLLKNVNTSERTSNNRYTLLFDSANTLQMKSVNLYIESQSLQLSHVLLGECVSGWEHVVKKVFDTLNAKIILKFLYFVSSFNWIIRNRIVYRIFDIAILKCYYWAIQSKLPTQTCVQVEGTERVPAINLLPYSVYFPIY